MIVDTRDAVFDKEPLVPSRGMWFEDITNNQPAYFIPRRGDDVEWQERPAVRQRLSVADTCQEEIPAAGPRDRRETVHAPETVQNSMVVDRDRLVKLYFTCPLCQKTLTQPHVLTGCLHRFCRVCIESWLGSERATNSCPTCGIEYVSKDGVPRFLCRDYAYEAMLEEILPSEGRSWEDPHHADPHRNIPRMDRRAMPSSLSRGMRRYTHDALQQGGNRTIVSLRPPTVIIELSFDHRTQIDWKYVTCPLDKTVWQLKQAVAKRIHDAPPEDDSVAQSLRFHLMLDVRMVPKDRKKAIIDALCPDPGMGIDDRITCRDIVHAIHQPACQPNSQELASSAWGVPDATHMYQENDVDSCQTNGRVNQMKTFGAPGDVSNRWPMFLHHVTICSSPPGECPHGETCDLLKSLAAHIRDCNVEQCPYPRCQPWRHLVRSHGPGCGNSGCLVCTLQKRIACHGNQPQANMTSRTRTRRQHADQLQQSELSSGPMYRQIGTTLKFHVSRAD